MRPLSAPLLVAALLALAGGALAQDAAPPPGDAASPDSASQAEDAGDATPSAQDARTDGGAGWGLVLLTGICFVLFLGLMWWFRAEIRGQT